MFGKIGRLVFCVVVFLKSSVEGWFEFCSHSKTFTVSSKDCPYGVLFRNPQDVGNCFYPMSGDHIADVCVEEHDVEEIRKLQYIDAGNDEEDGPRTPGYEMESCKDMLEQTPTPPDKCSGQRWPIDGATVSRSDTMEADPAEALFDPDNPYGNSSGLDRPDHVDVKNQTYRLFLYLHGLIDTVEEEAPIMRLVKLMRKSFAVLRKHCNNNFVTVEFGKEVLRSFLFLLREGNLARVKDISINQFAKINTVLDKCITRSPPQPFYLNGTVCPSNSKVTSITKVEFKKGGDSLENVTYPIDKSTDLKFRWGKYDIPLDATWSVMDFTHGMCYGTFRDDMNSHHLYEQALERLFTPELQYRWQRPPKLNVESYWDHALKSHTNNMMSNLDACIQGAYIGSPYLHRLRRPFNKRVAPAPNRPYPADPQPQLRKKRNVEDFNQMWCFKTEDEKEEALTAVKSSCSENNNNNNI